jgi:hypothetical protein
MSLDLPGPHLMMKGVNANRPVVEAMLADHSPPGRLAP